MKPLHLILKKKYFDQIKSGEKTTEYRAVTPHWVKRIVNREYSHIIFQMGYASDAPRIEIEYKGYDIELLNHEFFGEDEIVVFALKLGNIINAT